MEEKQIVIYKDVGWRGISLKAGVLISKNKVCKIRNFASGHFAGYRALVRMDEVISIQPVDVRALELLEEARRINKEWNDKISDMESQRNKDIESIILKIKELEKE